MNRYDVEKRLRNVLNSTPEHEMEAAAKRVLLRLSRERIQVTEIQTPKRTTVRRGWRLIAVTAALAAAVVLLVTFLPVGSSLLVEAADDGLHRETSGKIQPLRIGDTVPFGEIIRSDGNSNARFALGDGSHIELRSMSEFALERISGG